MKNMSRLFINNQYTALDIECPFCKRIYRVVVSNKELRNYDEGALVQDAFPHLSPSDREMLISGICDTCWDEMLKDADDEYDDTAFEDDFFIEPNDESLLI